LIFCASAYLDANDDVLFRPQVRYDDDDNDEGPAPDPSLEGGMPLPIRMAGDFPPQLFATPIEDIDPFYSDKKVRFKEIRKQYGFLLHQSV
jgi:hypothetical protein